MKQAVILAGGAGTRLRPLTLNTPKPMLDVNGRPFILCIMEELKKYGVDDFVLCIGYLADKFTDFFGDGSRFGCKISYSVEKEFAGTGGALRLAEGLLKDEFFVLNGDTYLPVDYADVSACFKKSGATGLLVVYDNTEFTAEPNIALDDSQKIISYAKKEPLKKGDQLIRLEADLSQDYRWVDAGAYAFKKNVLDMMGDEEFVSLEGHVYPKLIKAGELSAYVTSRRYYDLGTPERLELIRQVLK